MRDQNYLVIIGDVVKSREIENRRQFQEIFKSQFENIGVFDEHNIVSSFTITIGDEFQGVLRNAAQMFKFIADLEYSLNSILAKEQTVAVLEITKHLYKLRYGIGIGTITTKINRQAALGMDGPAFYNARKSIELARKNNQRVYFASGSDKDASINTLLQWLNLEIKKWNYRKFQIIKLYRDSWKQEQIAENLGISQPAVSKILKNSPVELMMHTEQLIENEMNRLLKQQRST